MDKKALMDGMSDFLSTVFIAFFLFLVVGFMIGAAAHKSEEITFEAIADFKKMDSAINNLRLGVHKGADVNPEKIDELVANSKVLGGKIITGCGDYFAKDDCNNDIIGVTAERPPGVVCFWDESKRQCSELKPPEI